MEEKRINKCLKSYLIAKKYYDTDTNKSFEYFKQCIKILNEIKENNIKVDDSLALIIDETETECSKYLTSTIKKSIDQVIAQGSVLDVKGYDPSNPYATQDEAQPLPLAAEEQTEYQTIPQLEKAIAKIKKEMDKAAKDLDFMEAARLRDVMFGMKNQLEKMNN